MFVSFNVQLCAFCENVNKTYYPDVNKVCNRPQAVVLLSSEPNAASENHVIMEINGKNRGRIGEREEKGRPPRFYCFSNYRFSETEIPDWSASCQSINKII